MEKLSRTLQTERNELKDKLKVYESNTNQTSNALNQSSNNLNSNEPSTSSNENNLNNQENNKEAESSSMVQNDETKQDQQPNDYVIINQEVQNEQGSI